MQLPKLVDTKQLRVEIKRLLRLVQHRTRRPAPEPLDVYPQNAFLNTLMKWAQALAMLHSVKGVSDFKSAFGDGRMLCLMVSVASLLAYLGFTCYAEEFWS